MKCEGRRGTGNVWLGTPTWKQCQNDAIALLTVEQEKIERLPVCGKCWNEARERKIKIWEAAPLIEKEKLCQ